MEDNTVIIFLNDGKTIDIENVKGIHESDNDISIITDIGGFRFMYSNISGYFIPKKLVVNYLNEDE